MKKVIILWIFTIFFFGCGMKSTPTKRVEELLNKYQTNDSSVISDLNDVLSSDYNMTEDEKTQYLNFMKKHYQDMVYKIKDERVDGDSATVDVEITVRNYSSAVNEANKYRLSNADEFDENNTFSSYRLKKMRDVTDTEIYTIVFHLTKINDVWEVDPLSSDDESKMNGLYGVNDINSDLSELDNQNDVENDNDEKSLNTNDAEDAEVNSNNE